MKRSVCLLLSAIYGAILFAAMVSTVESGSGTYSIAHGAMFVAVMLTCSGYLFNARPAAAFGGIAYSALALIEPQSWYLFIIPCLLAFAGWSKIRHEEMDVMAFAMEEAAKRVQAYVQPQRTDAGEGKASDQPAGKDPEVTGTPTAPVSAYVPERKLSLRTWWYFLENQTKVLIVLGVALVAIMALIWLINL